MDCYKLCILDQLWHFLGVFVPLLGHQVELRMHASGDHLTCLEELGLCGYYVNATALGMAVPRQECVLWARGEAMAVAPRCHSPRVCSLYSIKQWSPEALRLLPASTRYIKVAPAS